MTNVLSNRKARLSTTTALTGMALAMGLMVGAADAVAAPITFDFNGGCTVDCGLDGPNGNVRTFSAGGVDLDVDAFAIRNGNVRTAFLGQFNGGLGVTNRNEGNGGGVLHVVDNSGSVDYVRFSFSTPVTPTSVTLTVFNGTQADISYNFGDFSSEIFDIDASTPPNPVTVSFDPTELATTLRVFAQLGESNDDFKIRSLTVELAEEVPEPATLALVGAGLAGLGYASRRRRRAA